MRILSVGRSVRRTFMLRAVGNSQYADGPLSQAAGDAGTDSRVAQTAREEEILGSLKIAGVFEEERAAFGEKHLEALVDGHLRVVRFHLAEVGVDRDIESQGFVKHGLDVHAQARVSPGEEAGRVRVAVQIAGPGESAVGNDANVAARRDAFDSFEFAELLNKAGDAVGNVGPEGGLVAAGDISN